MVLTTTTLSLFELAVEAAVNIPFTEIDEFFLTRGQLIPDDLIVKCANATLPSLPIIHALSPHTEQNDECFCRDFRNISQSGFTIFATWSCRTHGSGGVQVKWCQKRITSFDCNCDAKYQTSPYLCFHASELLKRRVEKCPGDMIKQLAPLTNILMDLSEEQLREVLLEVASWDTSGKDLFDFDLGFEDPIEGIPDITLDSQYYPNNLWLSPQALVCDKIYLTVAKMIMAASSSKEFISLITNLIHNQIELHTTTNFESNRRRIAHLYGIVVSMELLLLFTRTITESTADELVKEVPLGNRDIAKAMNLVFKFDAKVTDFFHTENKNCIDPDVLYADIITSILSCQLRSQDITTKKFTYQLGTLAHKFDDIENRLNTRLVDGHALTIPMLQFDDLSAAEELHYWHKFWLSPILEVGSLYFQGLLNYSPTKKLNRLIIGPSAMKQFIHQLNDQYGPFNSDVSDSITDLLTVYWQNSNDNSLIGQNL